MAQIYQALYNADTTGNTPSGWELNDATNFIPIISTSNAFEGTKCVQLVKLIGAPTGSHWFAIDTVTVPTTGDYTVEATVYFATDATIRGGIAFRGKDAVTNECYVAMLRAGNSIRLSRLSGTSETVISTATITYTTGVHYHIKAYANGSDLKVRFWADGGAEPSTWDIETTDANLDNTNRCVGAYLFNGSNDGDSVYFDALTVNDFTIASSVNNLSLMGVGT